MKTRVFLMGSTQITHIKKLFESYGIECFSLDEEYNKHNWLMRKLIALKHILLSQYVYHVGGYISYSRVLSAAKFLNKKIIVHWIGTDVLKAREHVSRGGKIPSADFVFAVSPELVAELHEIGVEALELPIIPADVAFSVLPMPMEHAALAYLPEGREKFYGADQIRMLAEAAPHIPFYIVANRGTVHMPENVIFCGRVNRQEMLEIYRKTSVLVRLPEHDGLSFMLLEALGYGRQLIYKFQFPYAIVPQEDDDGDLIGKYLKVISAEPALNFEESRYVREHYNAERIFSMYNALIFKQ